MNYSIKITFSGIVLVLFTGCAEKIVYVDKIVKVDVPVKCKIEKPVRPKLTEDESLSATLLDLKGYILSLEAALETCN